MIACIHSNVAMRNVAFLIFINVTFSLKHLQKFQVLFFTIPLTYRERISELSYKIECQFHSHIINKRNERIDISFVFGK